MCFHERECVLTVIDISIPVIAVGTGENGKMQTCAFTTNQELYLTPVKLAYITG
jgi:hypothetical protein